jgi:putative membrane protein
MRWGILFRREVMLSYARIQDIHLTSNFIERWLRLARIQVSTASGSAAAEMTIEGLQEYELVRDFLYTKMRGANEARPPQGAPAFASGRTHESDAKLVDALREVSDHLRDVGLALEALRKDRA